ncbi:uncharacterized protein CLUP02_06986 [Colletotrichum lupini]|uniref:Uncharacterized protein n=1 Tax=Colletotrichum lupini TaxID=145971 RepID=A0A9Q8WG91_9PEZI|nr:uncharacterized protein CLUP02_06986 [Colletotrichum lupini]UQC81500.1 hypothetical protein CLUP02_06986 [Colletotrichum lupini]
MTTANGGTSHIVSGEAVSLFSRANLLGSVCRSAAKTGDKLPLLRERMEARSHIPAVHVMNPSLAVMKQENSELRHGLLMLRRRRQDGLDLWAREVDEGDITLVIGREWMNIVRREAVFDALCPTA